MHPMFDPVGESIKRCPFLHALVVTEGESFARDVAVNYAKTKAHEDASPVEKLEDMASNYGLFHGPQGILPLKKEVKETTPQRCVLSAIPTASISLSSFWGDFNFFRSGKNNKPKKPTRQSASSGHGQTAGPGGTSGQCPMRRLLGPLATAVMSGRYHCPKPIVMMRAAIARTSIVKALRPESLEIKLLAVAMASSLLNIPFGMIREHTRKFSPQWFLVVHATIPFIAMFRKAVVMPHFAIAFTVAAAIGGQAIGAKAERCRLQWIESQKEAREAAKEEREPWEATIESETEAHQWMPSASLTAPRISS